MSLHDPFTKTNLPQQDILMILALTGIFNQQFKRQMIALNAMGTL